MPGRRRSNLLGELLRRWPFNYTVLRCLNVVDGNFLKRVPELTYRGCREELTQTTHRRSLMKLEKRNTWEGWAVGYIVFHEFHDIWYYREISEYRDQRREMLRVARALGTRLRRAPVEQLWKGGRIRLVDRPSLIEVLKGLKSGDWRVLIIDDMGKLALNRAEAALLMLTLRDWGVRVIECATLWDLTDECDRWSQEFDASDPRVRSRALREFVELKKRVTRLSHGVKAGRKPFGELPGEADVIQRILRLRRMRSDGTRLSYQKIADELNDDGVPPRKGEKWYAKTIQGIVKRTRPNLD